MSPKPITDNTLFYGDNLPSLRQHGYPPDKQEKATQTVLEQAEVLCTDWAVA